MDEKLQKKALLFEYTFYQVNLRKKINKEITFLKWSKIFFLIAAIKATFKNHGLLEYFDNFYCSTWGATEVDTFEMWHNREFEHLRNYYVNDNPNHCELYNIKEDTFNSLTFEEKKLVSDSVDALLVSEPNITDMSPFGDILCEWDIGVVPIHLQWTAIQVANEVEKIIHGEASSALLSKLTTDDIIKSSIKAF